MPVKLKTKVMDSCLIPCLTYACQTWKFNKNVINKIISNMPMRYGAEYAKHKKNKYSMTYKITQHHKSNRQFSTSSYFKMEVGPTYIKGGQKQWQNGGGQWAKERKDLATDGRMKSNALVQTRWKQHNPRKTGLVWRRLLPVEGFLQNNYLPTILINASKIILQKCNN